MCIRDRHSEMVQLITTLHEITKVPVDKLLHTFGMYMFDTFTKSYPDFFNNCDNAFDFLHSIDKYIHVQVLKLYPDAELPKFDTVVKENGDMEMTYTSSRKMADFALGLIEKTLDFYNEKATIQASNIEEDGSKVLFLISKTNGRH